MVRGETARQARVTAVKRQRVLREVVRADAQEGAALRDLLGHHRCGGRLDHRADRDVVGRLHALALELARRGGHHLPGAVDLLYRNDHGQHQLDVAVRTGAQQRADLRAEDVRVIQAHPYGAPPQERVRLGCGPERRGELVPSQIVAADDHRASAEGLCDPGEELGLLQLGRQLGAPQHEELGAQQPHPLGAVLQRHCHLLGKVHVAAQRNGHAVLGLGRLPHRGFHLAGEHAAEALPLPRLLHLLGGGLEDHNSVHAVEDHLHPVLEAVEPVHQTHHTWDAEAAGEDGGVRRARALHAPEAGHLLSLELHREARRELPREHDRRPASGVVQRGGDRLAHQVAEHGDLDPGQVRHTLPQHEAGRL